MSTGKKYRELRDRVPQEALPLREALELLRDLSQEKFDASAEIAIRLGVNPRKAEENLRGSCPAPAGLGKTVRILAFVNADKVQEARDAGADMIGDDEIVQKIQDGWFEFDKIVATPDQMKSLARLGRVLGPKKLMPSPKDGTVTFEIGKAIGEMKAGKINFRVDRSGIVHAVIGKRSFDTDGLLQNARALIDNLVRLRPSTVKGRYIKSIYVSTTMGPGIKVDAKRIVEDLTAV